MPGTIDHIVEVHRIARERQANGQPACDRKINLSGVFHNDAMTFAERRDAVVRILRSSAWVNERDGRDARGSTAGSTNCTTRPITTTC